MEVLPYSATVKRATARTAIRKGLRQEIVLFRRVVRKGKTQLSWVIDAVEQFGKADRKARHLL